MSDKVGMEVVEAFDDVAEVLARYRLRQRTLGGQAVADADRAASMVLHHDQNFAVERVVCTGSRAELSTLPSELL